MRQDDLFEDVPSAWPGGLPQVVMRNDLVASLRAGPVHGEDDLECAVALTQLVHQELTSFGTGGGERLTNPQMAVAQRTLRAVLERQGIDLDLPWRDFTTFRGHWKRAGCDRNWQCRRDLLDAIFDPIHHRLEQLEEARFRAVLADPVSPHHTTGWPKVDEEIRELQRRFRSATTPQDYRAVGLLCVGVLEALSRAVYDRTVHLRAGESEPPVDKTKQRLGRYVEMSLAGKDNEAIRGVATKVIELAQAVKHSDEPTRREAGIAADATILLANILRRVDQDF